MGTNINANITDAKRASELTNATKDLSNIYTKDVNEQKSALSKLFTQKYFNSTKEKGNVDAQIEILQKKIEEYEKKIAEIQNAISDKQNTLNVLTADLAEKVAKIASDTETFEAQSKQAIQQAIENAQYHYMNDSHSKLNGGEKTMTQFIVEQMSGTNGVIITGRGKLEKAIEAIKDPQSKIGALVKEMEGYVGDIATLKSQYGTDKSTLDLLKSTSKNMTDAAGSYQTSDTDKSVPIFTPKKAELADGYLAQYNSRLADRENPNAKGATAADKKAVIDKYCTNIAKPTAGVDPRSMDNAQLASFGKAIDDGMLEAMQKAGFTKKEMLDTIQEKFPSIGIFHRDDGSAEIPYGHHSISETKAGKGHAESGARALYNSFTEKFGKIDGGAQRDDLQVAEMDQAIKKDKIVTEMKQGEFSWKECAYTITRLWPGAGIGYNLGEKEITIPAGSGDSKSTFDALAEQIKANYPDVKINRGGSEEPVKEDPKRTDPMGVTIGNNTYDFAIDRNQDGVLNDFTEMVGANGTDALEEMRAFADENGIISGDALNHILLVNTEHSNRDYEMMTAAQMGIKSIDLNSFKAKNQERPDGTKEEFTDINNNLVVGNFKVTMEDDSTAEGYQKYVSTDYMKAVYNPILGENIYSQLDGKEVDNVINKNFEEADNKLGDLKDLDKLIEEAKSYEDITPALRTKLNNSTNNIFAFKAQQLTLATNMEHQAEEKRSLEMSAEEADKKIDEFVDKYGKKKKEETENK